MPEIKLPDGTIAVFPEGMGQDEMLAAVHRHLGVSKPGGVAANIGAGANEFIAATAGAPADIAASGLNQLGGLQGQINAALPPQMQRFAQQPRPPIQNPVGGAESIKSAMGAMGADPRDVAANTPGERMARDVGSAIPATVAPYLGARALIERGSTGLIPRMLGGPAGPGQSAANTVAGSIGNAAAGAGAAVGGNLAQRTVGEDSPWSGTAKLAGQVAGGALTSGILGKAADIASRIIQPQPSSEVQLLRREGVTPTIGQILGGKAGAAEEKATSIPLLGDSIRAARQRANDQLNRAAVNRALKPIGESLDDATPLGREAIDEAWQKSGDAYRAAVPNAGMYLTPKAVGELQNLSSMAASLPDQHRKAFEGYMKTYLLSRISNTGHISGEALKQADSDLGNKASGFFKNQNSTQWDKDLGQALFEAQRIMRGALRDTDPSVADAVRAADATHAMMLRVGDASRRADQGGGVFTPAQLQAGVKKYALPRQYQRGDALMQDLSDAGRSVLGARVPDSGTAGRSMLPFALGAAVTDPVTAAKYGLGLAAAGGLYSPIGQRATAAALTKRPPWAAPIADFTRALAPPIGAPASYPIWGALAP